MKIIIPMAGRGSRFQAVADQNPAYQRPKPLIDVKGKPMVIWALESLPFVDLPHRPATTAFKVPTSSLIFICLEAHEKEYGITQLLKDAVGQDINVILIPEVTRGAVETVYAAKTYLNTDEDVIVSDSDHYFDGTALYETILHKGAEVQGVIPVFQPPDKDPKWSFTLFDQDFTALAVGEKDAELAAEGAYANIGGYYFSHGQVLLAEIESMLQSGEMYGPAGKQEFYVAPLYQRLIAKGMKIKAAVTPEVWGLRTPKDLEYFLEKYRG